MNIQIKDIFGNVLFEYDKENNTIKNTVIKAVEKGVNLNGANLNDADLSGANLIGADLRNANLNDANLSYANIGNANLIGANLRNADLSGVNLRNANLSYANLRKANLSCADLVVANLRGATLSYADLRNSDLYYADLRGANLYSVELSDVNLYGANLYDANLSGAKNIPSIPLVCPSEGSFIGWKKISDYKEDYEGKFIVKLLIPKDAKRSSTTTNKCRCDKAKVLEITNILNGSNVEVITNLNYNTCVYKVGEYVYPDGFDENRWNECSHGIHFFMEKEDAINY